MKVKDATIFPPRPFFPKSGIFKQHVIAMQDGFPPGHDRGSVDYAFTRDLGRRMRKHGNNQPISDNEYIGTAPATIIWYLDSAEHRPTAIQSHTEYTVAFQDGYQHYGRYGIFGGHASWMDWAQFKFQGRSSAEIQAKYDQAYTWEESLIPLMRLMDVCYPMIYGHFYEYTPGYTGPRAYSANFSYEDYKMIFSMALEQQNKCLRFMHWKPIEWFFTDNLEGAMYPTDAVPWVFGQLSGFKNPVVNMWNHPDYMEGWSNSTAQAMIQYNS